MGAKTQSIYISVSGGGGGGGTVNNVSSSDITLATVTDPSTTPIITIVASPKWKTTRLLAGNSVDGSTNVPFVNKFIVQGTTDSGLTNAQFLGALSTGLIKNTTTTGILSNAVDTDITSQTLTDYLSGSGTISPSDSILSAIQKLNGNIEVLTNATNFQGTWNASANDPTLASGIGTTGDYYIVSVAGTTTLDGISSWSVNDIVIFGISTWEKVGGNPSAVTSVNSLIGSVPLVGTSGNIIISSSNVFDIGTNVATLIGSQNLSNKTGLISQWTNNSGYITTINGLSAGGDLTGTYPNPTLIDTGVSGGLYGTASLIPQIQVDNQGRILAIITNTVIADAGTLTGSVLNSSIFNSSLTSLGTVTTGVWHGTPIDLASFVSGNLTISHLNSGISASSSTFWRGDGIWATTPGTSVAGSNTQIQYNNSSAFGANSDFVYATSTKIFNVGFASKNYLRIDGINGLYQVGDISNTGNGTKIIIDDSIATTTLGNGPIILPSTNVSIGGPSYVFPSILGNTGDILTCGDGIGDLAWSPINISILSKDLINKTATVSAILDTAYVVPGSPSDKHSFMVGGYINITASVTNTVSFTVTYTDENSTVKTKTFFPQGVVSAALGAVDNYPFSSINIRCKGTTTIQFSANVTGAGSITFDTGANIIPIN